MDEPELQIVKLPSERAADWQAEREHHEVEARRRYLGHVITALEAVDDLTNLANVAEVALDGLCSWTYVDTGGPCACDCHPQLPSSDLHDYGFAFGCRHTQDERAASWHDWEAEMDAYWSSPEGQRATEARQADERGLMTWLENNPSVVVNSHGGMAPEQWAGLIDGHSFYFRERHDDWRIELDLRPSGRFYRAWVAGDLDDDASYEEREVEEGDIIAEGTISAKGYGESPVERVTFICDTVRTHLARQSCSVPAANRDQLEKSLGIPLRWCPACGERLTEA